MVKFTKENQFLQSQNSVWFLYWKIFIQIYILGVEKIMTFRLNFNQNDVDSVVSELETAPNGMNVWHRRIILLYILQLIGDNNPQQTKDQTAKWLCNLLSYLLTNIGNSSQLLKIYSLLIVKYFVGAQKHKYKCWFEIILGRKEIIKHPKCLFLSFKLIIFMCFS